MKKILAVLFCLWSISAVAQQRYKGQWSASISGGVNTNNSYYANVSAENYRSYRSSWGMSVSMFESKYKTTNEFNFTVRQVMVGARYIYSFNLARPIYVNLGGGILLGYENPPARTVENKILNYDSQFNAGLELVPQIEFILHRSLSLFAEPRLMYLVTTSFENFIGTASAGLKIYF